ncbi:hypothetical protein [Carboxylicivirga marina]|uniref:Outer membrane protein beta-barrel domain-containing protein n=1 Tax=Carboxylicivirga marina TaxID=2800988 RepID=A0ABS1HE19_9BACT|nr:hypothetical protein [Carboxylicivirga marina]MBK3515905.1 hypothetical protein [Carboxylicivirga marina]
MRFFILLLLLCSLSGISNAQDYFIGGKVGYSFPTNIGNPDKENGFAKYANNGWQIAFFGKWFYNKSLSLGTDLGYQYQGPGDKWDVGNYGEFKNASYQTIRLLLNGTYYLSQNDIRPYIGVSFGAYYLINTIDFNATQNYQSIEYTAKVWKPGLAPQLGLLFELSKKTMLDIHLQMDIIANMEAIYHPDAEPDYTENPHEKQNQISIGIGLLFGL